MFSITGHALLQWEWLPEYQD